MPVTVTVAGGAAGSSDPGDSDIFASIRVKSFWSLDDLSLGLAPVFSEGVESGMVRGTFGQSFAHTVELTLTANHVYEVTMIADASARGGDSVATASAYIDPVFSFGPGVGPEYAFSFSPGIGNQPVPLPASLALLCVPLLSLCRASRGGAHG